MCSWSFGLILVCNCIMNVMDSLFILNLDYGIGRDDNGGIFYMVEDFCLFIDGVYLRFLLEYLILILIGYVI